MRMDGPLAHLHLAHLLLPYLRSYNHTAVVASGEGGADYPSLNFARLIVRLCSRNTCSAGVMATSGLLCDSTSWRTHLGILN